MQSDAQPNLLTAGSLWRGLTALAWPMFVSAILQNVQGLIDLFWVGRLGSNAVAAIALSTTILMILFPVVMGLCVGTVAFVARSVGAGQLEEANDAAGQSLLVALVCGLLAGVPGWLLSAKLCRLLGAAPEVVRLGSDYLQVSFLGSFTVFLLFTGNSILQGAGNAVVPMVVMLIANLLNLVLDPIFIFGWLGGPAMGVRGAALATVLAQSMAAAIVLLKLHRGVAGLRVTPSRWRFNFGLTLRIVKVGLPSAGQMFARSLMSLVLMRIVAACGTAAVAAYGIGLRFHAIILFPTFAIGNAAATMVGQSLGAGLPQRAVRAAWLATAAALALIAATAAALMALAPQMIRVFDASAPVVAVGSAYLRIVSPFYLFAALGIVLSRAQMGAGDTMAPMLCTLISLWGIQVPLALVLSRTVAPATTGIWWAVAVALVANGLLSVAWFQAGRWQHQRL